MTGFQNKEIKTVLRMNAGYEEFRQKKNISRQRCGPKTGRGFRSSSKIQKMFGKDKVEETSRNPEGYQEAHEERWVSETQVHDKMAQDTGREYI